MSFTMPFYATREEVKSALDSHESARNNSQIDRALDSASRAIEALTHRKFFPVLGVRKFDYPQRCNAVRRMPYYRLWLNSNELVSVSSLVSGGVTIASSDYFLRRGDDLDEPPYSYVEINLASGAAFSMVDTHQRQTVITGTWGWSVDTTSAGLLVGALDATQTTVVVSDSSLLGVGDLVLLGSEYVIVTDRGSSDTDTTLGADLTALQSAQTITLAGSGSLHVGETITVGAESMLVLDVTGSSATVKRAWDGSTLAAHDSGATIYAPRSLTVVRGAQGSTAATHEDGSAVAKHAVPGLLRDLCIAEAMNRLEQEGSAYARTVGSGDAQRPAPGGALKQLRADVVSAYGRGLRMRTV
jgi:hypothetical protein